MRDILVVWTLASSFLIAACASTAPAQMYRPAGSNDPPWQIDGEFDEITMKITIRIDGQTALEGRLSFLGSNAELTGTYKEKPVAASCSQGTTGWGVKKTQCFVFVSNERAATLQF